MQSPLGVRVVRVAAPVALVGVITAGVAMAASPGQSQVAYPAPVTSASAVPSSSASIDRHERGSRAITAARPSLSPTPSAKTSSKPETTTKPKATTKPQASSKPKATSKPTATSKPKATAKPEAVAEPVVKAPSLKVVDTKYARVDLNIRSAAAPNASVVTVVKAGSKLSVTSTVRNGYRYISYDGKGRWVKNSYAVDTKPAVAKAETKTSTKSSKSPTTSTSKSSSGGISNAPCRTGSSMESGISSDAVKVHRALCNRYPEFTSFGGMRGGGGNHGAGLAVDAMISNSSVGLTAASWLRSHASELGISELIYQQRIWTVQRSSEGWRSMSDRGSVSANHYDHVHISVYGNRATS